MTESSGNLDYQREERRRPPITPFEIGATALALVAGASAWVVPPHAMGRITEHYPETAWNWLGDGMQNVVLAVSLPLTIAVGFAYGLWVPRYWFLSFLAVWWVDPLCIALDVARFPTSHNLFPFELVLFAVVSLPAFLAALMGTISGKWLFRARRQELRQHG